MYHLIKKDLLMQKKSLLFALIYLILFTLTIAKNEPMGLILGILVVTYLLAIGSASLEDKNDSDIMLLSLPIKKKSIVLSKYVLVYLVATVTFIFDYILYFMVDLLNIPVEIFPITFTGFAGAVIAVTLFSSISFPLIFKLGYAKSKIANLVLFFGLVFLSGPAIEAINSNENSVLQEWLITFIAESSNMEKSLFVMIPLLVIVAISYKLSLTFYTKREF